MAILHDQERRKALHAAKAQVRELERPEREARKIIQAKARRDREKAIDRSRPEQRAPRVRDNAYLAWVRRLPCVCCGSVQRVEAAHIRAGYSTAGWAPTGMAQKPDDFRVAPLCASCHREGPDAQHRSNERAWWSARGIDPPDLCAALRGAYEANGDGAAVLRRFTPSRVSA